jgi:hypothetical protein
VWREGERKRECEWGSATQPRRAPHYVITRNTVTCAAAADRRADEAQEARPHQNPDHTDAGCAALASALDSGALPALEMVYIHMNGIPASAAAEAAVKEALKRTASRAAMPS